MSDNYKEQLAFLRGLQEIDLGLYECQLRLNDLPNQLKEDKVAFEAIKAEFDALNSELEEVQKQKKTDETDLEDSSKKLVAREAKLYAIKTNKEYQAALKEVSEGKRLNREREDRVLRAMEKIEELSQKNEQQKSQYDEKESALSKKRKELETEEAQINNTIEGFKVRRPELVSKIERKVLRQYDFIRKRYSDALVEIADGTCHGCHRRIPPQILNEMLRQEEFKRCPSCQRFTYIEEVKKSDDEETSEEA